MLSDLLCIQNIVIALYPRMRHKTKKKKKHCVMILVCFLFNHKKELDVDFCTVKELCTKLSSSSSWLYYSFLRNAKRKVIFLLLLYSYGMIMLLVGI